MPYLGVASQIELTPKGSDTGSHMRGVFGVIALAILLSSLIGGLIVLVIADRLGELPYYEICVSLGVACGAISGFIVGAWILFHFFLNLFDTA